MNVTYNQTNANVLRAGTGLDWFWSTNPHNVTTKNPSDVTN